MDFDERHSLLEESRAVDDLQICESCSHYHPHYDFTQNKEGQFICPSCAEKQTCEVCNEADPSTSIVTDEGEPTSICDGCYEKMI